MSYYGNDNSYMLDMMRTYPGVFDRRLEPQRGDTDTARGKPRGATRGYACPRTCRSSRRRRAAPAVSETENSRGWRGAHRHAAEIRDPAPR